VIAPSIAGLERFKMIRAQNPEPVLSQHKFNHVNIELFSDFGKSGRPKVGLG